MEEWKTYKLGDVCSRLSSGRGIKSEEVLSSGIFPVIGGNGIRGYCEKSNFSGICGVIGRQGAYCGNVRIFEGDAYMTEHAVVVVGNEYADTRFLAYLLSLLQLGHLSAQSAQPGLSVQTLSKLEIKLPPLPYQIKVSNILKVLDTKIELNRRINDNLEQQAQAAFDKLLEISATYGEGVQLSQYAEVNPTRKLHKGQIARCIDMSCLPTRGSFPSDWSFKPYEGGMKFINGDTIMARITPCLENGKTAYINFLDSGETAFGSTEYIVLHPRQGYAPEMLYFLSRNTDFVSYAVSHMNGSSGRQRVAGDDIAKYELPRFQDDDLSEFNAVAIPNMKIILNNSLQNRELVNLRDALLPKLMSGELKPDQINL